MDDQKIAPGREGLLGAVALLGYPVVAPSAEGWFLWAVFMCFVALGQLAWHYRDA